MKTQIVALEIELVPNRKSEPHFCFNDTTLRAIQSGLCVLYEEVFICASYPRLVVVAVGGSAEFLVLTFLHHRQHYKKMVVHESEKATQFLHGIVDGRIWKDCSFTNTLTAFQCGYDSSIALSSLGSQLTPMVEGGLMRLRAQPMTAERKNAMAVSKNGTSPSFERDIASQEKFYRFSIN